MRLLEPPKEKRENVLFVVGLLGLEIKFLAANTQKKWKYLQQSHSDNKQNPPPTVALSEAWNIFFLN